MPLGPKLFLGICRLRVLESWMKYCLYLFLRMAARQCWKDKERSRIRAVQMDNLRGLLGIRRRDRIPNARIRELCGVTKGLMRVFSSGLGI